MLIEFDGDPLSPEEYEKVKEMRPDEYYNEVERKNMELKKEYEKGIKILKDSGDRREFGTGAVRDMAEGKGRCDLLPACALIRLSKHFEAGAKKYSERNWENGMPISVMIDSGMRHLLKYLDGQTDEDHLCAAAWNLLGAMWMEEKHPELQDIPSRNEMQKCPICGSGIYYSKPRDEYACIDPNCQMAHGNKHIFESRRQENGKVVDNGYILPDQIREFSSGRLFRIVNKECDDRWLIEYNDDLGVYHTKTASVIKEESIIIK